LNCAGHDKYPPGSEHGFAASILGDIGSFHHNLLAHNKGRNWSMAGTLDGDGFITGRLDLFNNVVYNWKHRTTDGFAKEVNFVNNYYKPGASISKTHAFESDNEGFPGLQRYYIAGNVMPGYFDENSQDKAWICLGNSGGACSLLDQPVFESDATIHSATDAYKIVLSDVGCTQPMSDNHDIRMINETLTGTFTYRGSKTGYPGLIDSEKDAGGWEEYPGYLRNVNWDSDLDGLPNWWEKTFGLDTLSAANDFSESNADVDSNGYTNLEEYLHWMSKPHYFMNGEDSLNIDLSVYTRGFTNSPAYEITNAINGVTKLQDTTSKLTFIPSGDGLANVEFKVTDAEGSSMVQSIGIFNGEIAPDSLFTYTYLEERPPDTNDVSEVISQNFVKQHNLLIYPNPVTENVKIAFQLQETSEVSIDIYNTLGELIQQIVPKQSFEIGRNELEYRMGYLKSGTYIIKIAINDNNQNKLIIKR
jgi:hypothetical protein